MKKLFILIICLFPGLLLGQGFTIHQGKNYNIEDRMSEFFDMQNTRYHETVIDGKRIFVNNKVRHSSRSNLSIDNDDFFTYYDSKKDVAGIYSDNIGEKMIGKFKIKTEGIYYDVPLKFSLDGKYALSVSPPEENSFKAYVFDMATLQLKVKGQEFIFEEEIIGIENVNIDRTGRYFIASGRKPKLYIGDLQTGQTKVLALPYTSEDRDGLVRLIPSLKSDLLMVVGAGPKAFFDISNMKFLGAGLGDTPIVSLFMPVEGKLVEDILDQKISKPGIGIAMTKQGFIVFDHEQNYFMVTEESADRELVNAIYFDNDDYPLEYRPDPIPIISDVLPAAQQAELFNLLGNYAEKNSRETLAHRIYESAEPFEDDLIREMSIQGNSCAQEYFTVHIVDWINATDAVEIASDGKKASDWRLTYLKKYKSDLLRPLEREGLDHLLVDRGQLDAALSKLQRIMDEQLYMSVEGLLAVADQKMMAAGNNFLLAQDAARYYQMVVDKEPNNAIHHVSLGMAYMKANEFAKALESCNKALAIKPDYPLALYVILRSGYDQIRGNLQGADNAKIKIIQSQAAKFLANAPGDFDTEIAYAERAKGEMDLFLTNRALYDQYVNAARISEDGQRASAMSSLVTKFEANGATLLAGDMARNVAGYYYRQAESQGNRLDLYAIADAMYDKADGKVQLSASSYYEWARFNLMHLKRKSEGLKIIARGKKKYPADENFAHLEGFVGYHDGMEAFKKGNYALAATNLAKYVKYPSEQKSLASAYLAVAYYELKEYEKALPMFLRTDNELDSSHSRAYFPNFSGMRDYCKNPSGTPPEVKNNVDKIEAALAKYEQGLKLSDEGKYDDGIKLMKEVDGYFKEIMYTEARSITNSGIGVAYHKLGQLQSAKEHYRVCANRFAVSSTCYNNLAMIYLDEGKLDDAEYKIKEGLEKFPSDPALELIYAEYYQAEGFKAIQNKNFAAAIENLNKSIEYDNSNGVTYLFSGFAYYGNGHLSEAKKVINWALQLDPGLRNQYEAVDQILSK